MAEKNLPFSLEKAQEIIAKFPTPFHIYDEKAMMEYAHSFNEAFSWNEGFKEYYAIKSCPNPHIMNLFRTKASYGIDCSSMAELVLAEKLGMRGDEIMFTSNDTPADEFQKAIELGAIINLDDIKHIEYLEKHASLPDLVCFRWNPGALKEGNIIIGNPEDSKYGFTREQLFEGYKILRDKGVKRFGIHTMVASNELDENYFIETAELLFNIIAEISKELGIKFEFANLGGGIGVAYKPEEKPVDLKIVSDGIKAKYHELIEVNNLAPLKIFFESGRVITGPFGYVVSEVLHIKETFKKYVGLDACMANLMRPALYGSYHHITVLGKENKPNTEVYDVTGSLCENNDKFAINRNLPLIEQGDLVVLHDTGAHGHAMGFNYNGKLRSAELLLRENGDVVEIRRAETLDDYFATVDFDAAKKFQ